MREFLRDLLRAEVVITGTLVMLLIVHLAVLVFSDNEMAIQAARDTINLLLTLLAVVTGLLLGRSL